MSGVSCGAGPQFALFVPYPGNLSREFGFSQPEGHGGTEDGMCVMEAVSYFVGRAPPIDRNAADGRNKIEPG
jgi:hypothetical protein